ncbi:hypothetical protein ADIS_0482 [Lunatimonas lonarensis]|uniref:Uncharacterized protein n=1 Tax=Lunatimonas lonarensis TaxID=1232681 RepID=R7ZY43_9BACT|nr:hypothetical protein ADIS_0482 [Lunatimonas lonarensis]
MRVLRTTKQRQSFGKLVGQWEGRLGKPPSSETEESLKDNNELNLKQ